MRFYRSVPRMSLLRTASSPRLDSISTFWAICGRGDEDSRSAGVYSTLRAQAVFTSGETFVSDGLGRVGIV